MIKHHSEGPGTFGPQPEVGFAFTVVLDQTANHCVASVRNTVIPRIEKGLQVLS